MSKISSNRTALRGRIFPKCQLSAEEKARRKTESEAFAQRCREIFDRVAIVPSDIYERFFCINWFQCHRSRA